MKVMTPTKRLRSTCVCDKYSSRNCGIVVEWFGAHTYFGNGLWCSSNWRILAKVVVNRHLNPEDCSGMTWVRTRKGGRQKDFVL